MEWRIERRKINFVFDLIGFKSRQTNKTKNKRGWVKKYNKKKEEKRTSVHARRSKHAHLERVHIFIPKIGQLKKLFAIAIVFIFRGIAT